MRRALRIAGRGLGKVHPNPLVGAVLVRKNRILSEGAHEVFGGPHAEAGALSALRALPKGCTLYLSLEPCAHFGKTPPCTDLILRSGIRKVVIGASDPNPIVSGKGIRILKRAGVKVVTGVMEKEASALNCDFNHWVVRKTPYVIVKVAQSLDGKIATASGQSRWLSGEKARRIAHELRAASDAILVGVNTILKDDPLLSVRLKGRRMNPIKIVLDSRLRTPPHARIFSKESPAAVMIATTAGAPRKRRRLLEGKAELLVVKGKGGRVDWRQLLKILGKRGIVRLLVEGGGEVIGSAFSEKAVHEIYLFIAPLIIGGRQSIPSVAGSGVRFLKDVVKAKEVEVKRVGEDLLVHGVF